jgi:hypothetical protein
MLYGLMDFIGIWYIRCTWEEANIICNGLPYKAVPEYCPFVKEENR